MKANKRGLVAEEVVFILLNLFFFIVLLVFVRQSGGGRLILEEQYAKQIALMIDQAKPTMTFFVDMTDAVEIARKNNMNINDIVKIEQDKNRVMVKLGDKGGYFYYYYTKAKITGEMQQMYFVVRVEKND